jgi:hypothetical protein
MNERLHSLEFVDREHQPRLTEVQRFLELQVNRFDPRIPASSHAAMTCSQSWCNAKHWC